MKVPKLEAGGANWVIYKDRFLWSIDARGLLKHIDGSDREPICLVKPRYTSKIDASGNDTSIMVQIPFMADEEKEIKEWKVELKEWKQGEAVVNSGAKVRFSPVLSPLLLRELHGFCHGFFWGTGWGTEFCTPEKPVPVTWVRGLAMG